LQQRTTRHAPDIRATARALAGALAIASLTLMAGCGPVKLVATTNIPTPLVVKIPVAVGVFVPKEFSGFIHDEERSGTDWHIALGKAQTDGLMRLLNAMFERVVVVDSVMAGTQAGGDIRAVLEPSVEEYAFVTPRDAGSPFFAVSIKYRINVYTPDGRLADSWGFTGYGTAPSQGITSDAPLTQATALALRDAGAKLAVEFREQAIVRGLLPESAVPDTPVLPPLGLPAPAETPPPPAGEQPPAPSSEATEPAKEVPEGSEPEEGEKKPDPVVPESLV
jgi:hypothetical protein